LALLVYKERDSKAYAKFREYLNGCFHIKELGPFRYFLGIEVTRSPKDLFLCRRKYALKIIEECALLDSKLVEFPMESNHKLTLANGP